MEYFIKFWGGAEDAIERELGITERNHWFATEQERDAFLVQLTPYEHLGLAYYRQEGELTHKRTIAIAIFAYGGKMWTVEYDFGYEYREYMARFMFEDGNYSCDCNRSTFIRGKYGDTFPELDCGHAIEMMSLEIEYRP
jgi:hypothetical protein